MFLLTSPPYTMVTTFSMSASVTRRPLIIWLSIPNWAATLVAERPPPCTSILWPSTAVKAVSSWQSESSSSTILPPTLMMVSFSFMFIPNKYNHKVPSGSCSGTLYPLRAKSFRFGWIWTPIFRGGEPVFSVHTARIPTPRLRFRRR